MGIIRFLLAISVIIFHADKPLFGLKFNGGTLAVQSFFVISGFYMSLILNEKYKKENNSFLLFISNRLLRLYPIYFVVAIITILVFAIDYNFFNYKNNWLGNCILYSSRLNKYTILYIFFSNILIIGQDLALFLGVDFTTGSLFFTKNIYAVKPQLSTFMILGQAWTIGLEIMFYLLAPFIVRRRTVTLIVLLFCSLLARVFIYYVLHLKNDPWTYRFFPTELLYFLLGSLCYRAYKYLVQYD